MICQLCNKHMHSSTFQVCESCRSDLKALILTRREMMKQQEKVLFQETISFNGDQNFDETIEHHGLTFYKFEFDAIESLLKRMDKSWLDIKRVDYVCGLKHPYHMNSGVKQESTKCVDGYQVILNF